jgi:hypothetical protein
MGVKRSRDFILTLDDDDVVSHSESESENNGVADTGKRTNREEMNPDFEFDGYGVLSGVGDIEDDGWRLTEIIGVKEGASVDLDGIIARRRKNLDEEDDESDNSSNEEPEEDGDEEQNFKGFDDDLGIYFCLASFNLFS